MFLNVFSGQSIVEKGSHEAIVFAAVPQGEQGVPQPDLMKATGAAGKVGMSKALQNGWLKMIKRDGRTDVIRQVDDIEDIVSWDFTDSNAGGAKN